MPRRERRALDRDPPVALDEHEQDVLAAQAGQQPVAGRGAEAVVGDLRARARARSCQAGCAPTCTSSTARAAALEEATGAPTTRRATHSDAEHRRRPQRPAAVAGRDPRHAQQRQDRDGEERDDAARPRPATTRSARRGADRVAQRLDADAHVARVVDRLERPVERREEADVEDLHEHEHAQHRSRDDGQHAARRRGQQGGHGDDDEELEREPRERAEGRSGSAGPARRARPRRAAGRGR